MEEKLVDIDSLSSVTNLNDLNKLIAYVSDNVIPCKSIYSSLYEKQ